MFRVKMVSVFFSPFLQFCRNHLSEWHLWHQETKQIDFYSTKTIVNSIWWFSCPRCWQTLLAPSQRAREVTRTGEKDELVESESEENNCCNCLSKTKVWREELLQLSLKNKSPKRTNIAGSWSENKRGLGQWSGWSQAPVQVQIPWQCLNFDIAMGWALKKIYIAMGWIRSAGERGCSHWSDGRGHQQLGTGQSSTLLGEKLQLASQYFSNKLDS